MYYIGGTVHFDQLSGMLHPSCTLHHTFSEKLLLKQFISLGSSKLLKCLWPLSPV